MSARLKRYINKIERGEPLNYSKFLNVLTKEGISPALVREKTKISRQGRSALYRVDYIDDRFLANIKSRVVTKDMSRAEAALNNKSHAVRVNGSYILRRVGLAHPEVVIIDPKGAFSPPTNNRKALVIENRQNFLSIELTAAFLKEHCEINITDEWDLLFGAGGEIGNHLHERYLSSYSNICMLLDLDIGGLRLAKALAARTPAADHYFILPRDINLRLEGVVGKASQEIIEQALELGRATPFLARAARSIIEQKKTLEQESYIA